MPFGDAVIKGREVAASLGCFERAVGLGRGFVAPGHGFGGGFGTLDGGGAALAFCALPRRQAGRAVHGAGLSLGR